MPLCVGMTVKLEGLAAAHCQIIVDKEADSSHNDVVVSIGLRLLGENLV